MNNADKFKSLFGIYATELWAMPEKDFLKWLNSEVDNCSEFPNNWISCNERMPEEDNWLGGSGKQFSSNVLVSIVNRSDEDSWVDVSHTIDGEWALELPRYCKILAWQKLPDPYQPDGFTIWAKSVADSYRNDKEKSE